MGTPVCGCTPVHGNACAGVQTSAWEHLCGCAHWYMETQLCVSAHLCAGAQSSHAEAPSSTGSCTEAVQTTGEALGRPLSASPLGNRVKVWADEVGSPQGSRGRGRRVEATQNAALGFVSLVG